MSCCANITNSTSSTGFLCSNNVTIRNYNYTLPIIANATNSSIPITTLNMSCLQAFMNDTQPEGQTRFLPILNISSRLTVQNITNITIRMNQTINSTFIVYANDFHLRNNNSIILNTSSQVILKSLSGITFNDSSKGIWIFGICNNVSDNVSNSFSIILGGG